MSGVWLISYLVLWAVVLFQGAVIFVLLRQLGVIYLGTAHGVAGDGLDIGTRAPDFALSNLAGEPVSLATFGGLPLLLVFGSPSCEPCKGLIPDLNVFSNEHREELQVLFLSHSEADATARFAREYGIQVPVASVPNDGVATAYKARVTPFAFFIDGEGVIQAKGLANNREHLEMLVRSGTETHAKSAGHNGATADEPVRTAS
ncbi:MAG: redoxin domain-containing protein [Chloroflexi bacterium]|nr:redoxin domain-containing protein [Chloroflexota bacterium]